MGITEITGLSKSHYVPQIPKATIMPEEQPAISSQNNSYVSQNEVVRTNTDLEDVSLTFNKNESFDYLGSESDLNNLDMEKAISDMRKDKIFEEYQYFVGGMPELDLTDNSDGQVFIK